MSSDFKKKEVREARGAGCYLGCTCIPYTAMTSKNWLGRYRPMAIPSPIVVSVANRGVRFYGRGTGKMVQFCIVCHDDWLQVLLNILLFGESLYA